LEFEKEQLISFADASIEAVPRLRPVQETRMASTDQDQKIDATIESILQQAKSAPKVALMTLRVELEKQAQQALATSGMLRGRLIVPLRQALGELSQYIPSLKFSAQFFDDVSNKIIHGAAGTDDDGLMVSTLDSGISILRALNALPNEVNVGYRPGVEIFADALCTTLVPDAKGIILATTPPGGGTTTFRIFPTTRTDYQEGKQVAWEWNRRKVWPAALVSRSGHRNHKARLESICGVRWSPPR
jgi:hypothetical protein